MQESWDEARAKCQAALDELVEGKAEAFTSLWSHSDDTVIMGAFGGFEHGWKQVAERLKWASAGALVRGSAVPLVVPLSSTVYLKVTGPW